jgi:ribonuclease/clavin/mitogillin
VIEPATPYADEQAALEQLLAGLVGAGAEVAAILLTHHHGDHTGFAAALRERTGAPIHAHAATAERVDFTVDVLLADGAEVDLGGRLRRSRRCTRPGTRRAIWCTASAARGWSYAGDMVAGVGTILIDPEDGGDMIAYLASLERMAAAGPRALVPAHGPVQDDPQGRCCGATERTG